MLTIRSNNQIFRYFQYISILGKMNYNRQMMKRVFKFFKFWNFFLDFRIWYAHITLFVRVFFSNVVLVEFIPTCFFPLFL